jgi:hypothetical protein
VRILLAIAIFPEGQSHRLSQNVLGYVNGICGLGLSPNARRIGGAAKRTTGPALPMTIEKKMAGFSMAAHRRYRTGWEKNRGAADILSADVSWIFGTFATHLRLMSLLA